MLKIKITFAVSSVILMLLVVFTVFHPALTGGKYSEVQRSQLLRLEDRYNLQFDINNHEGRDTIYSIVVIVDGQQSLLNVSVRNNGVFTYVKHIDQNSLKDGLVKVIVSKEGDAIPVEEITHHLK